MDPGMLSVNEIPEPGCPAAIFVPLPPDVGFSISSISSLIACNHTNTDLRPFERNTCQDTWTLTVDAPEESLVRKCSVAPQPSRSASTTYLSFAVSSRWLETARQSYFALCSFKAMII